MNSRERLQRVLHHQPVDRVPISTYDIVAWDLNSWESKQPAYSSLLEYLRQTTDCLYLTGCGLQNRGVEITAEEWDEGPQHFRRETWHTPRGNLTGSSRQDAGINTTWAFERLCKTDEDVERFLSIPYELEPPVAKPLHALDAGLGERGILLINLIDPLCVVSELFEFSDFMMRAFTQVEQIIRLLDHVAPAIYSYLDQVLQEMPGQLFRLVGAEYATPPYLPPALFRRFEVGYTAPMVERIHANGGLVRIHSHGRVRQVLPLMLEMGVDATDPVEAPPSGDITLAEAKRLYGERLCLMGNIQVRDLETATPEQMRAIVREAMEAGKPDGGFVIMPTAAPLNADLSPVTERNYHIMVDTALEYGAY